MARGPRRLAAAIVGWVIVAIVLYLALAALMATLGLLVRLVVWAIVMGALIALYLNLRSPDS